MKTSREAVLGACMSIRQSIAFLSGHILLSDLSDEDVDRLHSYLTEYVDSLGKLNVKLSCSSRCSRGPRGSAGRRPAARVDLRKLEPLRVEPEQHELPPVQEGMTPNQLLRLGLTIAAARACNCDPHVLTSRWTERMLELVDEGVLEELVETYKRSLKEPE